ncbi:adenylate/guanylate cyclase domain-containing protein [Skermanella mucosa]|uniref:adenylate/guanylate cyclase domain-containing protein n=1 Tax=Skermanella mucosa TaxID=1789672 RepID=UPI00192AD743|nr:adenylate/guanylate cyclase domain-containing protein [Skermanella mucosa]UEM21343.1 adenylate/guanylate cyclase domain-containing protein [Skermanella mucosa]
MRQQQKSSKYGPALTKESHPQALGDCVGLSRDEARRFAPSYINLKTLFRFIWVGLGVLALAALYGALTGPSPKDGAIYAAVTVTVIGVPIVGYEVLFRRWLVFSPSRRWPFGLLVLIKSTGYAFWILLGTAIGSRLTHHSDGPPLTDLLAHRETIIATVLAAFVANVLLAAGRLLGSNVLFNFFVGRYHRPQHEVRLFLFLDVSNSTAIAETIGDLKFHAYLDDFFRIAGRVAFDCNGDVHDYIGDEIIVTWPVGKDSRDALMFFPLLKKRLDGSRSVFHQRYGHEIDYRAGMHLGPVVTGEVGEFKQKITFLGDTVNTAARLEQIARTSGSSILVSRSVLDQVPLPSEMKATPLGLMPVRGKSRPMEVVRLDFSAAAGL